MEMVQGSTRDALYNNLVVLRSMADRLERDDSQWQDAARFAPGMVGALTSERNVWRAAVQGTIELAVNSFDEAKALDDPYLIAEIAIVVERLGEL